MYRQNGGNYLRWQAQNRHWNVQEKEDTYDCGYLLP